MQPNKKQQNVLFKFIAFMQGSLWKYLGSVFAVLVTVLVGFITPLLLAGTVDALTAALSGDTTAAVNLPWPLQGWFESRGGVAWMAAHLGTVAVILIIINLLGGLFQYLRGKWSAEASETIAERMRNSLYSHLMQMDFQYHAKAETGDLIQRCTLDVETVRRFLASQVIEVFRTVIMIVMALTLMLRIHVKLTLLSLVLIPPVFGLAIWFFHWVQKLFTEADEADGKLSSMLQESMTGVRVVRAFARQQYETMRFQERIDDVHDKSVRISGVMAVYWSGSDMLSMLQVGMTLSFGIYYALHGEITTGDVLVFVSYIHMLIWPIRQLGRILSDLGKCKVSLKRIYDILDAPVETDTPGATEAPLDRDIAFEHVSFRYEDQPVLKDVSFTAKAGTTVAILGATGSGKSTMMHLLQRLYEPTGGRITIGGRALDTIAKPYLRSRVGYVMQEPFLYSRSIRDNIAIAKTEAMQEEIDEAARITSSGGFIAEFEKGYDTMVGERGVTLSGGQKQRIAIARTLIKENDVLILDDSLSAVDTETDRAIREELGRFREKGLKTPTTFIISHRVTTLADADLILVLEDGRITESGTHAELIHREGLYQRVYRIQAALEDELEQELTMNEE